MTHYHTEYTGPRWRYGSLYRPHFTLWWTNWIIWSDLPSADYPTFGTMDSYVEIPPAQALQWGLILVRKEFSV